MYVFNTLRHRLDENYCSCCLHGNLNKSNGSHPALATIFLFLLRVGLRRSAVLKEFYKMERCGE